MVSYLLERQTSGDIAKGHCKNGGDEVKERLPHSFKTISNEWARLQLPALDFRKSGGYNILWSEVD
jgi:hypothetical protein